MHPRAVATLQVLGSCTTHPWRHRSTTSAADAVSERRRCAGLLLAVCLAIHCCRLLFRDHRGHCNDVRLGELQVNMQPCICLNSTPCLMISNSNDCHVAIYILRRGSWYSVSQDTDPIQFLIRIEPQISLNMFLKSTVLRIRTMCGCTCDTTPELQR